MRRLEIMVGERFGKLVVVEETRKNNNLVWKCLCDCGNETFVGGGPLKTEHTKSCGCLNHKTPGNFIDMVGKKFGRLFIIKHAYNKKGRSFWLCKCECGNEKVICGKDIRNGSIKSCGCYMRERIIETHWNPDITNEERQCGRFYPEYREWRKLVYERDNYTCQRCGDDKGGNLVAHHIESYNSNKELRTVLLNGVTLCKDCHKDFHHQYGCGDNTREQWEEFNENSA